MLLLLQLAFESQPSNHASAAATLFRIAESIHLHAGACVHSYGMLVIVSRINAVERPTASLHGVDLLSPDGSWKARGPLGIGSTMVSGVSDASGAQAIWLTGNVRRA